MTSQAAAQYKNHLPFVIARHIEKRLKVQFRVHVY